MGRLTKITNVDVVISVTCNTVGVHKVARVVPSTPDLPGKLSTLLKHLDPGRSMLSSKSTGLRKPFVSAFVLCRNAVAPRPPPKILTYVHGGEIR